MCSDLGLYQPRIDATGRAFNNTQRYSFASTIFYVVRTCMPVSRHHLTKLLAITILHVQKRI